jgi:hypothetical protein
LGEPATPKKQPRVAHPRSKHCWNPFPEPTPPHPPKPKRKRDAEALAATAELRGTELGEVEV